METSGRVCSHYFVGGPTNVSCEQCSSERSHRSKLRTRPCTALLDTRSGLAPARLAKAGGIVWAAPWDTWATLRWTAVSTGKYSGRFLLAEPGREHWFAFSGPKLCRLGPLRDVSRWQSPICRLP